MAALSHAPVPRIVELRQVRSGDMNHLLEEETASWKSWLDWDFHASAALVRRFVDMQALSGFSLMVNDRLVGYSYYVCEDRKGLIGDLYVLNEFATVENETRLLNSVLDSLMRTPTLKRVESQLMMLRCGAHMALPHWRFLRVFQRDYMEAPLSGVEHLPAGPASRWTATDNWMEFRHDEASSLIAHAYQGHVDAHINDQYRSAVGARRFLMNIVQFPGCGSFFQPASFVSIDSRTGRMSGISLSSLVAPDVGHITQICVSKAARGKGVGYELLKRSLQALARHRCRKVSLTVTSSNVEAIHLYERMGFRKTREFAAHVWDGF